MPFQHQVLDCDSGDHLLGPPARCPFSRFFWLGGFPYSKKIGYQLILTSLLEDLVPLTWHLWGGTWKINFLLEGPFFWTSAMFVGGSWPNKCRKCLGPLGQLSWISMPYACLVWDLWRTRTRRVRWVRFPLDPSCCCVCVCVASNHPRGPITLSWLLLGSRCYMFAYCG